jgi:hypothetical protein
MQRGPEESAMSAQFCDECGVSLDLHGDYEDCESAGRKADLLTEFDRMFGIR